MTPSDVESMIRNLNARTTRLEQILPTLATKADLERYATKEDLTTGLSALEARLGRRISGVETGLASLETRLVTRIDDVNRRASVLHEDVKGEIGLLAEHLVDVSQKVDRHSTILDQHSQILAEHSQTLAHVSRALDHVAQKVDTIAQKIDTVSQKVDRIPTPPL